MVDETLAFLKKNSNQPCFVNLWLDDTHTPWVPANAGERPRPNLAAVIVEMDKQIGRLMDGVPAETLLIFATDNGALPTFKGERNAGLRGAKLSLYEGGIRLPFIVRWPGRVPAGRVDETTLLQAVDMMPTLAAIGGARVPDGYVSDGEDVSAALLGKTMARTKPFFWEYGRNETSFKFPAPPDRSPNLAMREGRWKLLVNADGTQVELYDVVADPNEGKNVAEAQAEIAGRMKAASLAWRKGLPGLPGK
jgi:arylsulfatase A-like enzyme